MSTQLRVVKGAPPPLKFINSYPCTGYVEESPCQPIGACLLLACKPYSTSTVYIVFQVTVSFKWQCLDVAKSSVYRLQAAPALVSLPRIKQWKLPTYWTQESAQRYVLHSCFKIVIRVQLKSVALYPGLFTPVFVACSKLITCNDIPGHQVNVWRSGTFLLYS